MSWRKAWARNWDQVRYCSGACRKRGVNATDAALETAIVDLLAQRAGGATMCPSEAAQRVGGDDWKPLMEPARRAARRLVDQAWLRPCGQQRCRRAVDGQSR